MLGFRSYKYGVRFAGTVGDPADATLEPGTVGLQVDAGTGNELAGLVTPTLKQRELDSNLVR